jgi:Integrase core domain
VWPGLAADVTMWCRACQCCARAKVIRQPASAIQPIAVPTTRFSHIHVDLVGPLTAAADGTSFLLTAVDSSTRWAEALPLSSTSAEACLAALALGWFSRYGLPAAITTDRGVEFTLGTWAAATARLGIQHITTTAYHPPKQRSSRKVPPPPEGGLKGEAGGTRVDCSLAMGPPRPTCSPT